VIVLANHRQGGYTAYAGALILYQLPHSIFTVSIFTALLPAMSSRWTSRDVPGFRSMLAQGIRMTGFVMIPAALSYIVLAKPIVRLLLQHGVATVSSTDLVSQMLILFSLGLFSFSAFQLLLRAFYSTQDTRTPALVNIAAVALNTVVNFVFFFTFGMGVAGLALGHAVAYTFAAIVTTILLRRKLGGLDGRKIVKGLAKALVAGGLTAAAAWAVARFVASTIGVTSLGGQFLQVALAIAAGLLVFVSIALLLGMEELTLVKQSLFARFRR
jgi:putative peptidoglycan lipid II flippase